MACSLISLETPDILEISEVVRNDKPELGRGSYGEVVEVTWKGKVCAGKKLHKSLLGSSSYSVETFKRECNTWSQLQNTHIVEFYGLFYEGGEPLPMIVMEKMDTSLYTYLSIDKQIKVDVSHQSRVDILNQVMRGLAYLHTHDPLVVHRDVTPSNILIDERTMSAKLTDFGVGKMLTRYETQMTKCPGNPAYMPPEVKENGVPVPGYHDRIDIFSLGCVIISVFTRTTPHPLNKDDSEYGKRQACVSLISGDADRFIPTIKRCLQDNPINRPHIRELLRKEIGKAFIVIGKDVRVAFVSDFFRGDFKSLKKLREGTTVAALYRTTFEQNGSTQLEFVAFGEKAVCQYDSEKDSDLRLVLFKDYLTQLEDPKYKVPSCFNHEIAISVVDLVADTFRYLRSISQFQCNNWFVILAGRCDPAIIEEAAKKAGFSQMSTLSLSKCAVAGKMLTLREYFKEVAFVTVNLQNNTVILSKYNSVLHSTSSPDVSQHLIPCKLEIYLSNSDEIKMSHKACFDEELLGAVCQKIENLLIHDRARTNYILISSEAEECLSLNISTLTSLYDEVICGAAMLSLEP